MHVYPEETNGLPVSPTADAQADPNLAIQSKLSETQSDADRKAADQCVAEAAQQVLGRS
ncbi:hypothetical protein HII36_19490 [Nonomuraea sp. NN258]|uniref:hypothetical protein n=1 Tax=Nonomuraea antri TaxID=2730852 RepID=UPI0015691C9C|nr:hypothetical protein [Nonomuraea antri]NRQ34019.1 hypothetical protein [Nonomuraea antri]